MGKSKELAELGDVVTQDGGNMLVGTTGHFNYSGGTTEITVGTSGTGSNAGGAVTFVSNNGATTLGYTGFQESEALIGTMGSRPLKLTTDNTARLTIDTSGRVTMPYQAGFAAYSPATGTGGQNAIVYGATYHNIGNHYNTSTGIFTAPIAGRYLFTASCLFNYSSGAYHRLDFRLNGTVYNSYGETLENQAGPSYSSATISNIFTLNANDTMQMWNGSNTTTYGSSYGHFSGIMLA